MIELGDGVDHNPVWMTACEHLDREDYITPNPPDKADVWFVAEDK